MSRISIVLLVLSIGARPVGAGVVFEIETKDHRSQPAQTDAIRMAVEGRSLTIDIAPSQASRRGGAMLYRGDRREMTVVDHQRKSFFVMDARTMQQLGGQINAAMSQARGLTEQALQGLSSEQRAMLERTMKDRMPAQQPTHKPQTTVRRLDQSAQVYGYPCQLYEVRRDGRKIRDLWVTEWSNIEGGSELAPVFADMGQFHRELISAMPQIAGQSGGMVDSPFTAMKEIDGFPVASRDYASDGTVESETALRSAKRQRLDPAAFNPPTGYKRQEMFGDNQSVSPPSDPGGRYGRSPR